MVVYEDFEENDDMERFDAEELDDSFPDEVEDEDYNISRTNYNLIRTMMRHYRDVDSSKIMDRLVRHNVMSQIDKATINDMMFSKALLPYPQPPLWNKSFNNEFFWGNLFLVLSKPSNNLPYQVILKEMIIKRILERKKDL